MAQTAIPFGEYLRRLREERGLTQEQLAERAGLSSNAIAALESGRRQRPYPSTMQALSDALGLSEGERTQLVGVLPRQAPLLQPSSQSPPGFLSQPHPL